MVYRENMVDREKLSEERKRAIYKDHLCWKFFKKAWELKGASEVIAQVERIVGDELMD